MFLLLLTKMKNMFSFTFNVFIIIITYIETNQKINKTKISMADYYNVIIASVFYVQFRSILLNKNR